MADSEMRLSSPRHQWIFITDTVDAVYRPNEWFPTALLDRLAEVVGQLPSEGVRNPAVLSHQRVSADNCRFLGLPVFRRLVCIGTNMEACRRLIRHARCVDRCCRAYTRSIASVTSYRSFRERVCRRTRASIRAVERSTGRRLKKGCSKICLTADRLLTSYHTFLYILALISCTHYTLAFHHHFSRIGTRPRVLS